MQYEAIYENGQITWLAEKPSLKSARIMISILEEIPARANASYLLTVW
jgi:hypothetical protein